MHNSFDDLNPKRSVFNEDLIIMMNGEVVQNNLKDPQKNHFTQDRDFGDEHSQRED